jgi:hypothetical protein
MTFLDYVYPLVPFHLFPCQREKYKFITFLYFNNLVSVLDEHPRT